VVRLQHLNILYRRSPKWLLY